MIPMLIPMALMILSASSHAFPATSFEAGLGAARQTILAARSEQKKAQEESLVKEIEELANEADRLRQTALRMQDKLGDILWRLGRERRPGGWDPILRADLDRLVGELKDYKGDAAKGGEAAARILKSAGKDPALVAPAQNLRHQAKRFLSQALWLERDGEENGPILRAWGFDSQAWGIERATSDAMWAARNWWIAAKKLLDKVK